MAVPKPARTRAFISYSHKDEKYLDRLHVHIGPLIRENKIDVWDDTRVKLGADWRKEINEAIDSAKIAILLVSADFLNSVFITTNELPQLLKAAEQDGLLIFSVILGPSLFIQTELARYQTLNIPSKPLIGLPTIRREEIWQKLAEQINIALSNQKIEALSFFEPTLASGLIEPQGEMSNYRPELTLTTKHLIPPRLIVSQGGQIGRSYNLLKDKVKIGRTPECEVFLDDPTISTFHASIAFEEKGQYWLYNRRITYLTRVNDHRVFSKYQLQDGDEIEIGRTTLTFVTENSIANIELNTLLPQPKNFERRKDYTTPENNELPRAERSTAPMGLHGTQQSSRLVILQGKWPGRIYRIYKASITIGRNKESDIILEESNVSRKHATIYQTADNEYWIRDEDSTNGMMVNGYRRSACLLQDGDDIEIGETILRFFC